MCNDARIEAHGGVFRAAGAPTEAALVVRAACKFRVRVYPNLALVERLTHNTCVARNAVKVLLLAGRVTTLVPFWLERRRNSAL